MAGLGGDEVKQLRAAVLVRAGHESLLAARPVLLRAEAVREIGYAAWLEIAQVRDAELIDTGGAAKQDDFSPQVVTRLFFEVPEVAHRLAEVLPAGLCSCSISRDLRSNWSVYSLKPDFWWISSICG